MVCRSLPVRAPGKCHCGERVNPKLINFVAFQVGWFACVLSAAHDMPWLGLLLVTVIVALHVQRASRPAHEARLVFLASLFGIVFDSLLVASGWVQYSSGMVLTNIAPYWIIAMWALFATTLNLSMSWLKNRLLLASVLGAIFGPLSYMAGQRLGAIEFIDTSKATIALALAWSVAMPLLMHAAGRTGGGRRPVTIEALHKIPAEAEQ